MLALFSHTLALFVLFLGCQGETTDFCKLKCGHAHTVCNRKPCHKNKKCGGKFRMEVLNETSRGWVLDVHNEYRNKVARNNTFIDKIPGAANMRILSYSKELEFVAQCWANNCNADGVHDRCRSTSKFENVGQNIYARWMMSREWDVTYENVREGIVEWFYEYKDVKITDISCYGCQPIPHIQINYFTQLAWAETSHVGCGIARYGDKSGQNVILICNYGPGGNAVRKKVFIPGASCTGCPGSLMCNHKYEGLCGESESLAIDTWTPPFDMTAMGSQKFSRSATTVLLLVVLASFFTNFAF